MAAHEEAKSQGLGKGQNNVRVISFACVLWQRVKQWRSKWEECVKFGAVDGAIAPSELYVIPYFDPALDSRVGSLTTSTKPCSGKHHLVQPATGQCSYVLWFLAPTE